MQSHALRLWFAGELILLETYDLVIEAIVRVLNLALL